MGTQKIITTKNIVAGETFAVNDSVQKEIKVTVHIPSNVAQNIRQQKVNRIYDILNPDKLH